MKLQKKIAMVLLALALAVTAIFGMGTEGQAAEVGESVDFSAFPEGKVLIGYSSQEARGVYYLEGTSSLVDCGGGKIGAGGATTATRKCRVAVDCIVERLVNGAWVRVTSWSAEEPYAYDVMTSQVISVASGYWYRVRCIHTAATDVSNSNTNALWM